jgi:hypothetical protein
MASSLQPTSSSTFAMPSTSREAPYLLLIFSVCDHVAVLIITYFFKFVRIYEYLIKM